MENTFRHLIFKLTNIILNFIATHHDCRNFRSPTINKIIGNTSKIFSIIGKYILPVLFKIASAQNKNYRTGINNNSIIISFTSYPARINNVWLVLECMFRQTILPDKIILYLSEEQYPTIDFVPPNIKRYICQLFEIRIIKGDYKSHKKYYYTQHDFPNKSIITIDDDIIYPTYLVERLSKMAEKYTYAIPAMYCHRIYWNENGCVQPYSKWASYMIKKGIKSSNLFFGSGGGTYFPPGSLSGSDIPFEVIDKICPSADDIWLNAITRKNGFIPISITSTHGSVPTWSNNNQTLSSINNGKKLNDRQLINTINYFKQSYNIDVFCKK